MNEIKLEKTLSTSDARINILTHMENDGDDHLISAVSLNSKNDNKDDDKLTNDSTGPDKNDNQFDFDDINFDGEEDFPHKDKEKEMEILKSQSKLEMLKKDYDEKRKKKLKDEGSEKKEPVEQEIREDELLTKKSKKDHHKASKNLSQVIKKKEKLKSEEEVREKFDQEILYKNLIKLDLNTTHFTKNYHEKYNYSKTALKTINGFENQSVFCYMNAALQI